MYCSNCGAENSKKICTKCGVKQDETHNFCKWCGSELGENASVCINCKKKVKENKLVNFLVSLIEIVATIVFVIVFIASFSYFSQGAIAGGILLLLFGLLGFAIVAPFMRKVYAKKVKINLNKPLRIIIPVVFLVAIYGFVFPFANNQAANVEKQKQYDAAMSIMESDPLSAKESFLGLADFEDSSEKAEEANEHIYAKLDEKLDADFVAEEDISEVEEYIDALPEDFDDSLELMKEYKYKKGVWMIENHYYAMAKHLFNDISDYKDVGELLKKPVFGLIGNGYTYTSSVTYRFENYIQTQLLNFSDSINHTFHADYYLVNTTTSNVLQGDFGDMGDALEYGCYEENGKIILEILDEREELKPLTTEDGKITSFLYKGNVYEIGNTD